MSHDDLDARAQELKAKGADGLRLEAVRRARDFKRSWIDMAEVLVRVRNTGTYKTWGYQDFHAYCAMELELKPATVDKLTGSYATVERHAPEVLRRDGLQRPMPAVESVDWFAKALNEQPANDEREAGSAWPKEVVDELKHAVFDEGLPVASLRRKFDAVLHPKSDEDAELDQVRRVSSAVRKLRNAVEGFDAVDAKQIAMLTLALDDFEQLLDAQFVTEKRKKSA